MKMLNIKRLNPKKRVVLSCLFLFFCSFSISSVQAEIVKSDDNSFDLQFEFLIDADPTKVSKTFEQVSLWWHPSHTYSGDSNNLSFDKTKGCFCETLENNGFVRHLEWAFYQPHVKARFLGGLGPLQSVPVDGVLTFDFSAKDKKQTMLKVSYLVTSRGEKLKGWAKAVNGVINEQLTRLKTEAEK